MSARAGAVVGAVVVAALLATLLAWLGAPAHIVRSLENDGDWYARSPGWFLTRGVYPPEHDPQGAAFAWASGRVRLAVPRLDRRTAYRLDVRARSGRPATAPPTIVRVVVDGLDRPPLTLGADWQDMPIDVPAAPAADGAVVLLEAQQTFSPGATDPRALGFMVERLTLTPLDAMSVPVPRRTLVDVALLTGAAALAVALCAWPWWVVLATGAVVGAAAAWLVRYDAAYLSDYSAVFVPLAMAMLAVATVAIIATRVVRSPDLRHGWRAAVLIAVIATVLRLAVFDHPAAPIGDGMFHVHRAQAVRAGEYLFTSVTPRPFYEFPYPVGLYVVAQPWWTSFTDRVALLRGITLVTDALVALAIFAVIAARWDPMTGVLAAALALAVPVVTQTVSVGNLTNAFAQSCFSLALVWIGGHLRTRRWWLAIAGAVLLLSAGWLSHFSTAVIGGPAVVLIVACVAAARDRADARAWRWLAVALLLAAAVSYVVYYAHFTDVYARTLAKIGTEKTQTSLVATLAEHSESKPVTLLRFLVANYGWAGLGLSLVGAVVLLRRDWRDGFTLVLLAMALAVAGFLALGAFTPIEMRANLAAQPIVAIAAAAGAAWLWRTGHLALRAVAVIGVLATVWLGVDALRSVLG